MAEVAIEKMVELLPMDSYRLKKREKKKKEDQIEGILEIELLMKGMMKEEGNEKIEWKNEVDREMEACTEDEMIEKLGTGSEIIFLAFILWELHFSLYTS